MEEIWKDVQGYEGRYQVSNLGGFKSPSRSIIGQVVNSGYRVVHLFSGGKHTRKTALIHRIVAIHFLPPSTRVQGSQVNHLNGVKTDNRACNLEWCSRLENMAHAVANNMMRPLRKKVAGTNMTTGVVTIFESQSSAEKTLSGTGKNSSAVHHCLIGKKKSAYGCVWSRV